MAAAPEVLLPQASRVLPALLLLAHGLGIAVWLFSGFAGWTYWAALGGLFISGFHALQHARRPLAARLELRGGGGLSLVDLDGVVHETTLSSSSRDLGWVIWLHLRPAEAGQRFHAICCVRDAFPGRDWHRLKRWLRFPPP